MYIRIIRQVALTMAIGATVLGGYMYYRFDNDISAEYTGVSDEKKAAEALAGKCVHRVTTGSRSHIEACVQCHFYCRAFFLSRKA